MNTPAPVTPRVTFGLVADLIAPWRKLLILIGLTILVGAGLDLIPPLLTRQLVDDHLSRGRIDGVLNLALIYLAATGLSQAISFATTYLTAIASQGALHAMRVRLFAHLQKLPMTYFDRNPLGDTISRCTADVETLDTLFSSGVISVVTDLVRLLTIMVTMLLLSPLLTAVSAVVILPVIFITNAFRKRIREAERANRRAVGMMNAELQETLGGVEVIRAFGRELLFVARFRKALRQAIAAFNRSTLCSAAYTPMMAFLAAAATAALLWSSSTSGFHSLGISLGTLIGFIQLFQRFFKPIVALGDDWQTVQSALSGTERVFQVLLTPADSDETDANGAHASHSDDTMIDLRDIVFGYRENHPILHGVSISIHAGEQVALVGRTGAGKSSILHLVGGLYPAWQGDVRIVGRDPRQFKEEQRRRVIGVVPQKVQLFSGTVLDNLTLGDNTIPQEAVQEAAAIAGADEFITSLPQGYDTPLSDTGRGRGVQLSAGQRQLLALARALVWDPEVLLLDEATAAIDHGSEASFREALHERVLTRGHAVITVAHRLSTARDADRIIVLERGRIVEQGTPEELIRLGGRFSAWLELESSGWDWHENTAR